jgi:hypothetical protein
MVVDTPARLAIRPDDGGREASSAPGPPPSCLANQDSRQPRGRARIGARVIHMSDDSRNEEPARPDEARAADLARRLFALPPKTRKESTARKPKPKAKGKGQ